MKTVEVSESALESLKAMVEQLQGERDELLSMVITLEDCLENGHWQETKRVARELIAKCTQTQSICDWQEKMNG